jgi:hypothetical protein
MEDIEVRREATEAEIARIEALTMEQNKLSVRAESDAQALALERTRLEFYDKALRADELLKANPQSLEALRGTYSSSATWSCDSAVNTSAPSRSASRSYHDWPVATASSKGDSSIQSSCSQR